MPEWFVLTHTKFETPHNAILVTGTVMVLLLSQRAARHSEKPIVIVKKSKVSQNRSTRMSASVQLR